MKFQFLLFFALLGVGSVVASNADSDATVTNYDLENVVVSATGTPRRLTDSPVPVSVITKSEIESTSATTLTQVMELLSPSFSLQTNSMGTTMMFNGMDDDYFVLLVDGQEMQLGDALDRVDLSDVERVEVLSGASSLLYGTNAVGGVISIITNKKKNKGVSASNTVDMMSKGRLNESVNVSVSGDKASASVYYRYQQADSWMLSPYMYSSGELVANNKVASAAFKSNLGGFRANFDVNDKFKINANASYYDFKTERPEDMSYSYNLHHESLTYGVGMEYDFGSNGNKLTASYSADDYMSEYVYFSGSNEGTSIEQDRTHDHNANVRGVFNWGEENTFTAGVEYDLNTLRDITNDPPISYLDAYTFSLYMLDEAVISKNFRRVIGVRFIDHESFGYYVTPNAALMYKLGKFNFRATYSAGYRTPELNEMYAQKETSSKKSLTVGNGELEPEKSDYISLSAEYNINNLSISVTGFQNHLRNMITTDEIDNISDYENPDDWSWGDDFETISTYVNVGQARVNGVTASVNLNTAIGLKLNMGYTYLDTHNLDDDTKIHQSVEHSATFAASWAKSWDFYKLDISLNGRYNGPRFIDSSSYDDAPAYQTWDINTYHTFTFDKFRLKPGIGISNIFDYTDDRPYTAYYATLTPGRSIYASLLLYFK